MKKLIVNADDFGLTEGVNRAIIDGHRNGIITSATLMANGEAFDSAVAASSAEPALGVGVHLNLTQDRPVLSASEVPSLVRQDGSFFPSPGILARRIMARKVEPLEVEKELRSQIEKVAAEGIPITHLDSHKHVHLLPPIFDLVLQLARSYGIDCVRCPVEPASGALGPLQSGGPGWPRKAKQYLLGRALSTLAVCQVRKVAHAGIYRADYFFGLSQTGFLDETILEQMVRAVPEGVTEIMCHPGYVDATLKHTRTRLRAQRKTELDALMSYTVRQAVAEMGIKLISYGELPPGGRPTARKHNEAVQETLRKG